MDDNKKQRTYEFQKLTPYEKTDMEGYDQSLSFVFKKGNEDLKNIALTGNYGSGKSSVIRSYAGNHKELSFIYVSLAHFEGVSGETDKENYDVNVEEKIINHLVQQIPTKNVPESGFRIKRSFSVGSGIWIAIRVVVLFFVMAYLSSWETIQAFQGAKIWSWITGSVGTAIILCLGFADAVSLIYSLVKSLNTIKKIKSLKFKDGTLEFDDQSEKSYFDQHLDEILYLLSEAKVDAVVFEDIDRFEKIDLKVLEHLRELCTLANDRIRNIGTKRKPVRFFYLIGDHIFKRNTDRTKFFDYMIPVIPIVDASNSYAKMREFLEESGDYAELRDRFLRGLCLYLDDLRTIKNIVNEFQIYNAKLSDTAQDPNQLLALIVYKNIYPDDFSLLQQDKGYLYYILCSKAKIIEAEIKAVEAEIENLKGKLDSIEKERLVSIAELEAVNNDRRNNSNRYKDYTYNEWNSKIYPVRSEAIEAHSENGEQKVREEIVEKEKYLTHIRNQHLANIISDYNEAVVFGYKNVNDKKADKEALVLKENNQLVEFLVRGGFIDETTYKDYIALFYEKGMSYKDKDFLISVNSHNGKPFDYEVQDLSLLVENLDPVDFIQPETRNFSLIDYIIEHGLDECIQKFVFQLQDNSDYEFIAQYIRVTKDKTAFIEALNKYWIGSIVALISNDNKVMSLEEIQDYLIVSLGHIGKNELKAQNRSNLITLYITDKLSNASCDSRDCKAIGDSLLVLEVKLPDIDKQVNSAGLRKEIYARNLYVLNRNNVESFLKNEYGLSGNDIKNKELTAVYSDGEQPLAEYVYGNISEFIENIVVENSEIYDNLEISADVINSADISGELKDQYISRMTEEFDSLEGIEEKQWQAILEHNKLVCNADEIIRYFKKYSFTEELTGFINAADINIDYTAYEDESTLKEFFDAAVRNKGLDNERYREIIHQIGNPVTSFNITGLGNEKLIMLIEENLIPMSLQNLQFIRQHYTSEICNFVEMDVSGYLGLIQGNNILPDELLTLISDKKIDIESRKKLADQIPGTISLVEKSFDDEIIIHVLTKKYDANDMPFLIKNYSSFSNSVKETVYKKLKSQIPVIKTNISEIASEKELLNKLFKDEKIAVSEKINLLDLLITRDSKVNLRILLQNMGFSNMTKLVSGDTSRLPSIKNGVEEKAILSVLKKHGFIEDFSADDADETIRVERKKSIFGKHGK